MNVISKMGERKLNMDYDSYNCVYPFKYNSPECSIIIDNLNGSIKGQHNIASIYLGFDNSNVLNSGRLESLLKIQLMSNPLEFLKILLDKGDVAIDNEEGTLTMSTIITGLNIKLEVDPDSLLPKKAVVQESDFLLGDTNFEVVYGNWVQVNDVKYPTEITQLFRNQSLRKEVLSNIELNPEINEDTFTPLETDVPNLYNIVDAKKGMLFSQWYQRMFYMNLTLDQSLFPAFVLENVNLSQFNLRNQYVGENIKIIGRPDVSVWSVAIKTDRGIYIVDSPISPSWSRSIINAAKEAFPEDNVVGVIPTHVHGTHFSGIRELSSEVSDIYVGSGSASFVDEVLMSDHTLVPDTFSSNNSNPMIHTIENKILIDGGEIEAYVLKTQNYPTNPHSEDLVVVYVPEYKALIQADFYYAGIAENIFKGLTARPFSEEVKQSLKSRAQFLLSFIQEKKLDVENVIGVHGGLTTMDELVSVSNY
jgi:glyoxylase-like metal-dependent hydrolase (beta-lactamase superfamily II)